MRRCFYCKKPDGGPRCADCITAQQAAIRAELDRPSFPPREPLMSYPKRGPGGLVTERQLRPGVVECSTPDGSSWLEVSEIVRSR